MANNWKGRGLEMSRTIDVAESFKIFKEPSRTELFKGTTQRSTRPIHNRWKKNDFQLNDSLALSQKPKKRDNFCQRKPRWRRKIKPKNGRALSSKSVAQAGALCRRATEPEIANGSLSLSLSLSRSSTKINPTGRIDVAAGRASRRLPPETLRPTTTSARSIAIDLRSTIFFCRPLSLSLSLSSSLASHLGARVLCVCVCVCVWVCVCDRWRNPWHVS